MILLASHRCGMYLHIVILSLWSALVRPPPLPGVLHPALGPQHKKGHEDNQRAVIPLL